VRLPPPWRTGWRALNYSDRVCPAGAVAWRRRSSSGAWIANLRRASADRSYRSRPRRFLIRRTSRFAAAASVVSAAASAGPGGQRTSARITRRADSARARSTCASATRRAHSTISSFAPGPAIERASASTSGAAAPSGRAAANPWRSAFRDERARPNAVFGPRLLRALARLAASFRILVTAPWSGVRINRVNRRYRVPQVAAEP